jgi:hypothetical protein
MHVFLADLRVPSCAFRSIWNSIQGQTHERWVRGTRRKQRSSKYRCSPPDSAWAAATILEEWIGGTIVYIQGCFWRRQGIFCAVRVFLGSKLKNPSHLPCWGVRIRIQCNSLESDAPLQLCIPGMWNSVTRTKGLCGVAKSGGRTRPMVSLRRNSRLSQANSSDMLDPSLLGCKVIKAFTATAATNTETKKRMSKGTLENVQRWF